MKTVTPISAEILVNGRAISDPQLAPSGHEVAVVTGLGDMSQLAVINLDTGLEEWLPLSPPPRKGTGVFGWLPDGKSIIYIGADDTLYRHDIDTLQTRQLSRWPNLLSALSISPDGTKLACVVDTKDVMVASTDPDDPGSWPQRVSHGADFVFDPVWSADSQYVAWHEWDVPDMPWDGGRIVVRKADSSTPVITAFEKANVAVQQPRFSPDGTKLTFMCDGNGWMNIWTVDVPSFENARPLVEEESELAPPAWGPGQRSYIWTPDGRVVYTRNVKGWGELVVVDGINTSASTATVVDKASYASLTATGNKVAGLATSPIRGLQLEVISLDDADRKTMLRGPLKGVEERAVDPEYVSWTADDGETIHGRLYRTRKATAEQPPLIVWIHGGPTGQSPATFFDRWIYFVDRGWNILVVDYRGSTGWGRHYAQELRGKWGQLDVTDTLAGARAAIKNGWGDPTKIVPIGGSSAGTTILLMLAMEPELFPAAAIQYPVCDVLATAEETWRFEAHYFDTLIGPLPDAYDSYLERSPQTQVGKIRTPLLLLHGDADIVVPVAQSEKLVETLRKQGCQVDFHIYEGEGHGWKRAETRVDELKRIEAFLNHHVLHNPAKENQ